MPTDPTRRAAVLGRPVSHSRSPALHNAGYAAAGLRHWTYTSIDCGEAELRGLVDGLGQEWAGLSLTMPLKEEALRVAALVDPFAQAIGAANTLVRRPYGWHAYNTDAPGMVRALLEAGVSRRPRLALLGGGGTARAAIAAAASLAADVTIYTRRPEAAEELRPVADALDVALDAAPWEKAHECAAAPVVISTVPKGAADHLAVADWSGRPVVFDAIYDPWPTPLAAAAQAAGCAIVSGLDLLLWQAVDQFELFTGVKAPVGEMRAALSAPA
ncbi:shikimate dehydrogenase [Dactylosporangium fulvum]|uniref:Shikimate dehydrogenase n=1 Tax=Dactylosporangium fulvum TaxID=53359 RepID=A0ABY5VSI6_9ACTN|nr:shikimate dehydrogenase [Dactylosporangium fulvum]UWP80708.1 shikimate dehydrogenase [Dactylosporangium fulvum]